VEPVDGELEREVLLVGGVGARSSVRSWPGSGIEGIEEWMVRLFGSKTRSQIGVSWLLGAETEVVKRWLAPAIRSATRAGEVDAESGLCKGDR